MKTHHALLIGGAVAIAVYLGYKNWQMFLGGVSNQAMGGFDFGILDPSSWGDDS